jgi:hypothetical protein
MELNYLKEQNGLKMLCNKVFYEIFESMRCKDKTLETLIHTS